MLCWLKLQYIQMKVEKHVDEKAGSLTGVRR